MPSVKSVNQEILELTNCAKDDIVIDLGSGFGTLAIFLAINLPEKKIVGYEISFFPYFVSIILKKCFNIRNLDFYKKDFLQQDLKNRVLVCYLFPKAMERLEDKIFDETINTTIVSSTFAFRNIKYRKIRVINGFIKTPVYYYET